MWGIIPAAGHGSRIQPLAFSKELLPVGSRFDGHTERPRAVSEYIIERMLIGGVDKICFVIAPGKSDILEYYGAKVDGADLCYVVQSQAAGLCDALFRALPLIRPNEEVVIGLPDTIWFPAGALLALPRDEFSFLLFPVQRPELFDAVITDDRDRVVEVQVKSDKASSNWVWGAFKLSGVVLTRLFDIWSERGGTDAYIGTLVNAYIHAGGKATAARAGEAYVDVGTLHGYREAMRLLNESMTE
jgi:dTDP-glucose pyrophosphorylase